jgi:hypothetical protein
MNRLPSPVSRVAAGPGLPNEPGLQASRSPLRQIALALNRARYAIILSAATYFVSLLLGIGMVSAGVPFAVQQRDSIVTSAEGSPITDAYKRGDRLEAALLDFGSNLLLGAGVTSVTGFSVIGPFPIAAYTGWVGGIVSIDAKHVSRLTRPGDAIYYLVTLLFQLSGFVLAMAAGIHVGVASWRARNDRSLRSIAGVRIPGWALRDAGWLYVLVVPILLIGSLWEFLS